MISDLEFKLLMKSNNEVLLVSCSTRLTYL